MDYRRCLAFILRYVQALQLDSGLRRNDESVRVRVEFAVAVAVAVAVDFGFGLQLVLGVPLFLTFLPH
ncbi:hypothetical protein [Silvimonas iriomotensis]|uniref:hypothetical protein n=1 Tax=Silvimonas iriomotensis TaxID=449662 RepID=UPI00166E6C5E|nr:hypothetical protein [Silvimonas iriomotensis]